MKGANSVADWILYFLLSIDELSFDQHAFIWRCDDEYGFHQWTIARTGKSTRVSKMTIVEYPEIFAVVLPLRNFELHLALLCHSQWNGNHWIS
jgi:hypothetical protein